MANQSGESDTTETDSPTRPGPPTVEQHEATQGAGAETASLTQESLEKQTSENGTPPGQIHLSESPPNQDLAATLARPPHSGWEATTINMAKCDYCDQRRRGTLYRCSQCQIAICKTCFESGILDHDTKHALDVGTVKWDLHAAAADKSEKKAKKAASSTTKFTTLTRARAAARAKAARAGKANKAAVVQATTVENEEILHETMTDAPIISHDENQEQEEAGAVLEGLSHHLHAPAKEDCNHQQAVSELKPMEPVRVYYQSELHAPKAQRPLERQVGVMDARARSRKPLPSSAPTREASRNDKPRLAATATSLRPILPRPIQPRLNPYEQPQPAGYYPQHLYGHRPQSIVSGQRTARERERGYRAHPYRSPREEYETILQHEVERRRTFPLTYNYGPIQAESRQPQRSQVEHYNIDPRLTSHSIEGNHQAGLASQQHSYGRGSSPLPSIRALEQSSHYDPTQSLHGHIPAQQPQWLPDWNESIIHRLGYQLEADALVTRDENPNWALDECLRHEMTRVWTRRNATTSLLQEAIRQDPNAGKDDVGIAFRTLLSAHYLAGIRLRLELQNGARHWIIERLNQLVADGHMEQPRATLVWGRLN